MAHLRINSYTAGSLKKEIASYWVGGEEKKNYTEGLYLQTGCQVEVISINILKCSVPRSRKVFCAW